ncbi:MAG: NAD(P)/FAD-dependent oxidoreductase [Burkholderiales bacterium]|nr:NAD(P)/FAD-dependent oxidoreductase [Burkholderiales bacterium]
MDQVDCVVIGAGVVGLAVARALAQGGHEVVIVEAEAAVGTGVSSRNSEVIHAGLYYEPGSLKSRLCVWGNRLMYRYCAERHVPHQRCGKLVLAPDAVAAGKLAAFAERARAQGVGDLRQLSAAEVHEMEPALRCHSALLSPSSGIVDSHGLMTALLADAEAAGALLAVASPLLAASKVAGGWQIRCGSADDQIELQARWLVNCAGLQAQAVATHMSGFDTAAIPQRHLARGHYFSLAGRAPFKRLIYPMPVDGGLGVHLTLDLGGQARFGPDVQWLNDQGADEPLDYRVDPRRGDVFYEAVRSYWPGLPEGALIPAYSGIRPKLSGPGEAARDFVIAGPQQHGCDGVVQLFGIESPGLTASLAIAEVVATMVGCGAGQDADVDGSLQTSAC